MASSSGLDITYRARPSFALSPVKESISEEYFSHPRLSYEQYRAKKSSAAGRPATSSTMTQSSLAVKLSSSQLIDPEGYSPQPSLAASPVPGIASPSQPPSVSADIRSSLPTHLWAALEQRWSEGRDADDHGGVLLSVDDEMVSELRAR